MKSGVQKYIRRGEYKKALWCANELDLFAYIEDGERIRTNLIHRLMVIYVEDVGIANLGLWKTIDDYITILLKRREKRKGKSHTSSTFRKSREKEICAICNIVKALSASPKSRIPSHYSKVVASSESDIAKLDRPKANILTRLAAFFPSVVRFNEKILIKPCKPSFDVELNDDEEIVREYVDNFIGALEHKDETCMWWLFKMTSFLDKNKVKCGKHLGATDRSKSAKICFFVIYLINEVLENGELPKNKRFHFVKDILPIARKWCGEISTKEQFLMYTIPIIALFYKGPNGEKASVSSASEDDEPRVASTKCLHNYLKNIIDGKMKIDDYILDMHTAEGRKHGKNRGVFGLEGAHVENEWEGVNPEYRDFYSKSYKALETGEIEGEDEESEEGAHIQAVKLRDTSSI